MSAITESRSAITTPKLSNMPEPKTFPGFSPKALTFLRQLEKNNSRDWFNPRKEQFEQLLRQPMLDLAAIILHDLRSFAVDHVIEPKKAVHRIYRDVRFSKDKLPYKTNISAMFPRAGLSKLAGGMYYFSVSPKGLDIAGGMYMPGPVELAALRAAIAGDATRFRKVLESKPLLKLMGDVKGEQLTRMPKGYEEMDQSAGDLIRRKQFYFHVTLDANIATKPGLAALIVKHFRQMAPMVDYLNRIVLAAVREAEGTEQLPKRPAPMF